MLSATLIALLLAGCGGDTETLIPPAPGPFKGIHGLTFDNEGRLLVGSVVGRAIYEVDTVSGAVVEFIGLPHGMADDLEQGPDGTLVWTAILEGRAYARGPDDEIRVIAENLPGMNSVAWNSEGRLFATQVFDGDALWELDPTGETKPRLILSDLGGLNGFDFAPDGRLYGPLWFKKQVVSIDVDTGDMRIVADGFGIPAAVNFDSKGTLYAVDTQRGEVLIVDIESGEKTLFASVDPAIDNLAIAPDDSVYISNMADNAILHIWPDNGEVKTITSHPLSVAADVALVPGEGGEPDQIYVAGVFSLTRINALDKTVEQIASVFGNEIEYPMHIDYGDGMLMLSSWSSGTIQMLDAKTHESAGLFHDMGAPHSGVVVSPQEVLYVDLLRGALVRFNPEQPDEREDLLSVQGLTAVESGTQPGEYFLLIEGDIQKWVEEGNSFEVLVSDLNNPEGLTLGLDGKLYVAEIGSRRIVSLPADGSGPIREVAAGLNIGFPAPGGIPPSYIPTGIAADAQGRVYYTSDVDTALYRVTPE